MVTNIITILTLVNFKHYQIIAYVTWAYEREG